MFPSRLLPSSMTDTVPSVPTVVHLRKEGGSFVCRYGNNDVCASLPLEGVSDEDYEAHVLKHHVLSQKEEIIRVESSVTSKTSHASGVGGKRRNGQTVVMDTPRTTRTAAGAMERVPVGPPIRLSGRGGGATRALDHLPLGAKPAGRAERPPPLPQESDFFIKTWGDHFTDTTPLPPCLHVPTISRLHFESYLARTSRMFLKPDFSLEDPETFHTVIPWSVIQPSARKSKETLAPKQTSRLLQEKLSHYLDIVEVQIARQVSLKSDAFFQAMTSHDALSAKMTTTLQAVSSLSSRTLRVLLSSGAQVLVLISSNCRFPQLQLMATVHQAQPTIQRLLATSDFVRALDFIEATREILTLELAGVQSFRHLDCQLIEIEKVIDKMMQTDFLKYATADLNRPLEDDVQVANEEHLVAVVFGMLRLRKQSFVDLYKEEACTAVKATVKQDGFLDKLSSSSFVTLCKAVDSFTAQCNETCKHKSTVLLLALRTQADRFVSRFHEERKMKLSLLLDSEQWTRVDIPPEFQNMVNHVVDKDVLVLPEKELLRGDSSKGKPKGYLEINSEKYGIAGSAVMMLKMVLEYCQCAKDIPFVALNLLSKLQELLRNFNSRTSQLVLGAGALQLVGLKTITASVLALTARCLQLLLFFLPKVKTHFEVHLTTRREMAKHFDQIHKEYAEHVSEIFSKLAHIVGSVMDAQLNNWEVKAPVPSPAFRAVAKHLSKFHGAIAEVLSPSDVVMLLGWVHAAFTQSLRAHLTRLAVAKDGGPQHGLVTQELTFYAENLKSLGVPVTFDDLWQAR
ncbi:hypothetical protein HPB47_020248 [Ixodes persulcatus]|uniref:Uncharacterized protein n=1 Tax=Ixodes persulcatus TaxID=34615 RepID=A0AC60QG18_IXOPE|nr:hypothetical protein HPB47_020248 [Ixodes persulcatus]